LGLKVRLDNCNELYAHGFLQTGELDPAALTREIAQHIKPVSDAAPPEEAEHLL